MHKSTERTNSVDGNGNGATGIARASGSYGSSRDDHKPLVKRSTDTFLNQYYCIHYDVVAAIIASLGAVSLGLVLGYSSLALTKKDLVLRVLDSDEEKISWFGSLVAIGAIFGGPIAAAFVGNLGRKITLMLCTVPMGIGWFMIVSDYHYILVFCGRVFTGIGMGMVSLVAPLYIAEVSSKKRRGILGSGFQLFVTVGVLSVYAVGMPLDWNWLAVVCLGVTALNILLLLVIPETPRWYVMQGDRANAFRSLEWLLDKDEDIDEAYSEIERNIMSQMTQGFACRDLFQPGIYRPMLITFGLMFFTQMTGINVVIFYSSDIFAKSGYAENPVIPTIVIGAVLVVATLISCFLMDVAGRRVLLLISGVFMTASTTTLGAYYYLTEVRNIEGLSWLSLASILVFVTFFSFGWGPIPWLVTAEIIPVRARSIINGLATAMNWLLVFLITKDFQGITALIHNYGAFWFFGGFCFIGCFFVFTFLPETKGRSLEEIHESFER